MPYFTHLLVVHQPRMLGGVLVGVVADRVALDRFRLVLHRSFEMLEPVRPARREDRVREHAPAAGFLVHLVARLDHHLVGEEPVALDLRRRR
jgi:hypothetical protein